MVLQKIIFQMLLDNKDIAFVLFVLNIIYMYSGATNCTIIWV